MAERRRFTDRYIQGLRPRTTMYEVREADGFGVRVLTSGTKSWFFIYDLDGNRRRVSLGRYPTVSLAKAREAARGLLLERAAGKNPAEERLETRRRSESERTVAWLVDEYVERYAKKRKRTWAEDERLLKKYVLPEWGKRPMQDVSRRDVIGWVDDLVDKRGLGVGANRVFAVTRKMFNWAVTRDLIEMSPCALVQAPAKENQRTRNLSESEIKTLWKALESATTMSRGAKLVLKLQLATGLRVSEVCGSSWSEIGNDGWWTIPAERSKNGRQHRVPISSLVAKLLAEARRSSGKSPWIFPSPSSAGRIRATSVSHALAKRRAEDGTTLGLPYLTTHDLRRTVASRLAQMGTPLQVIEKVMNHTPKTVTDRVYDQYSYDAEKRAALERWGSRIEELTRQPTSSTASTADE